MAYFPALEKHKNVWRIHKTHINAGLRYTIRYMRRVEKEFSENEWQRGECSAIMPDAQPVSEAALTAEELAFVEDILAYDHDGAVRLIFADWLEERSDPRAAWLRAAVAVRTIPYYGAPSESEIAQYFIMDPENWTTG